MSDIRSVQLELLDLFKKLIKILERANINYFAIGGTALGAVRHKGFIPWDDDIDIGMLRPDYERFLKLQKDLPNELFMINYVENNNFPYFFTKLMDNSINLFDYSNRKFDVPNKLFIDVFPWDEITEEPQLLKVKLKKNYKKFRRLIYKKNGSSFEKIKYYLYKMLYGLRSSNYYYLKNWEIITKKSVDQSHKHTWGNVRWNDILLYNDIFPLKKERFENIDIYIPRNYEKYLSSKYGDYMTLPENEKRKNHSNII